MRIEVLKNHDTVNITNDKYGSVRCIGNSVFPDIGVPYDYLVYSDTDIYTTNTYRINNDIIALTADMISILEDACINWEQPLGQEGNPTEEQKIILLKGAVQESLDAKARVLGFDDLNSISKYLTHENRFKAQALSLALIASKTWEYVEDELIKVETGVRIMPTPQEFIQELSVQ